MEVSVPPEHDHEPPKLRRSGLEDVHSPVGLDIWMDATSTCPRGESGCSAGVGSLQHLRVFGRIWLVLWRLYVRSKNQMDAGSRQ